MNESEKPRFMQMLAETLAAYGKALPEAAMARAWLSSLAPFPLHVVAAAMQEYRDANGEFAPVPAGIAMRCKLNDGRPGVEEAWAIALTSRDESDTVVWTAECAEAFAICRPILNLGDEVGARMAFKEAYARIVGQARTAHRPAAWSASIGWDAGKRDGALSRAVVAGLLPAPEATALLLGGPADAAPPDDKARAQLAAIKQMLADSAAQREAAAEAAHEQRIEAERAEKATLQQRVETYVREQNAGASTRCNEAPALSAVSPRRANMVPGTKPWATQK